MTPQEQTPVATGLISTSLAMRRAMSVNRIARACDGIQFGASGCFAVVAMTIVLVSVAVAAGPACDRPGDDQYPNSIMAPEPGTTSHHRSAAPARSGHPEPARPRKICRQAPPRRKNVCHPWIVGIGAADPLPRTTLIPPEGDARLTEPAIPQQQGPSVVPGLTNPVPNLPHGAETFQDRAVALRLPIQPLRRARRRTHAIHGFVRAITGGRPPIRPAFYWLDRQLNGCILSPWMRYSRRWPMRAAGNCSTGCAPTTARRLTSSARGSI